MDKKHFAVLRTEKLKTLGNVGGASAHNTRVMSEQRGYNKKLQPLNSVRGARNAAKAVKERIEDIYADTDKKPRSNAVLAVETVLTASPGFFDEIAPTWRDGHIDKINEWVDDSVKYLEQLWGKENVIQVAVHFDESTPHIHALTVPQSKTNKHEISAFQTLGSRQKLAKIQDDYATAMSKYGLERGLKGSKAHHVPPSKARAEKPKGKRIKHYFKGEEQAVFITPNGTEQERKNRSLILSAANYHATRELAERAKNDAKHAEDIKRDNEILTAENKSLKAEKQQLNDENRQLKSELSVFKKNEQQASSRLSALRTRTEPKPGQTSTPVDQRRR